jgi:PIN domain nuclease of toxin-antitoxin system
VAAVSYLDTHVAAWLFAGDVSKLSAPARTAIEADELLISPAVVLELQYLYETKRVADNAETVVNDLQHRVMLRVCDLPFPDVARHALTLSWTRDPFDRLIVAQATVRGATLITKDRVLRKRYSASLW